MTTMIPSFILKGTSPVELKSSKALQIVATCVYSNISLKRQIITESEANTPITNLITPPATSSSVGSDLYLELFNSTGSSNCHIRSTNASLRWLGGSAPHSFLLGVTASDKAMVDSWLCHIASSVETPVEILLRGANDDSNNATIDFQQSLQQLDSVLLYATYLAGGTNVTVADIRLLVTLYTAASAQLWKPNDSNTTELGNLKRWYDTLIHQDWFEQSIKIITSDNLEVSTSTTAPAGAAATSGPMYGGVLLNGVPTAVENHLYRRRRVRMKEILGRVDHGRHYIGQTVTVAGWARTIRKASSKLIFVELNDGSIGESLQCVLNLGPTNGFDACKSNGGTGSSFSFTGVIVESTGGEQVVDLKVTDATLLGAVYGGNPEGTVVGGMLYPLSKKEHTLEHMRDVAHLRARNSLHAAAMRIRHAMAYATHTFFHNHGFLYIHTPILTGADCEGAGEQFGVTTLLGSDHHKPDIQLPVHKAVEPTLPPVVEGADAPEGEEGGEKKISKSEMKRLAKQKEKDEKKAAAGGATTAAAVEEDKAPEVVIGSVDYNEDFFCQRVNLTVSGQLNVETHACALSDVYTFGPTFRAEESRTYRHLSEFWMIEPEIAFASLSDDIDLAEDYLKYCVKYALEHCQNDLEFFERNPHGEVGLQERLKNVLHNEFKRLTYTEAIEILQKAVAEDGVQFEVKPEWGIDLPSEHERYICEKVFKMPVVLTDYPKEIKAFYMKVNDDNKTVAAADILVPKIGEIIGGSQREHRYEVLKQRCIEMHLDPKAVWWYLDLRRYGTVPHAGFGLGFERLILFITGLDNIRDVIPFPRWVGNAKF